MRLILLGVLLTGCGDGTGEGAPVTACVSVDGPAPCCAPPEVVCPDGSERYEEGALVGCATPEGRRVGPYSAHYGPERPANYGAVDPGSEAVTCHPETGRVWSRATRLPGDRFCGQECWDINGRVATCDVAVPACE